MTDRKQALERTANVRAKIIAFLSEHPGTRATLGDLRKEVPEIDEVGNISSLLGTMVKNGLIKSLETVDDPIYDLCYYVDGAVLAEQPSKRTYNRKSAAVIERPEVRVEADRIIIDHPKCRIIVELK